MQEFKNETNSLFHETVKKYFAIKQKFIEENGLHFKPGEIVQMHGESYKIHEFEFHTGFFYYDSLRVEFSLLTNGPCFYYRGFKILKSGALSKKLVFVFPDSLQSKFK
jgi:hypothetical protein